MWPSLVKGTTTFRITTHSTKCLFETLSITDAQHKKTQCHYAERCDAECRDLFIVMLNVVKLNVIILSVVMLNVVAPFEKVRKLD